MRFQPSRHEADPGEPALTPGVQPAPGRRRHESASAALPEDSPPARRSALGELRQAVQGWRKHTADERYIHGFGIASTSLSTTPFETSTLTPRARPFTGVVREGVAELPPHPRLANLAGGARPVALAGSPTLQALDAPDALDRLFRKENFLHGECRAALLDEIKRAGAANGLTSFETTALAQTLEVAFGQSFDAAQDARAALRSLPRIGLLDALRHLDGDKHAPVHDADKAWALAQTLARVPGGVGTSLLEKLTPRTPRPAGTHASVIEKDRILLGVLLEASRQVVVEAARPRGDRGQGSGGAQRYQRIGAGTLSNEPGALFRHGALGEAIARAGAGNWPGRHNTAVPGDLTLAQKALLAVKEELRELDAHVDDPSTRAAIFSKGTHGCRFAIPMIRGGMLTDRPRNPDGSRSQFHLVETRLSKGFGAHLDRAMGRVAEWRGFMGAVNELGRHFGVYRNKSPFKTLNRIAEHDPDRGMDVHNRGGIHSGRAFYDMIRLVQDSIDERPGLPEAAAAGDAAALRLLVRSSIMQTTRAETALLPRYAQPGKLSALSQGKLVDAVLAGLPSTSAGPDPALRAKVGALAAAENLPLTAQRLRAWAADVGGPASDAAAVEIARNPASAGDRWRPFAAAFDRVENDRVEAIAMPSLEGKSREQVAGILADIVAAEELGSGFVFDNAGNVQGTTKNVTGILSMVPLKLSGSVRLDLGGGKIRTVRFESTTSADRSQLRISATTLRRVQAGAGGSVGHFWGTDHPVTFGGGLDVGHTYEVAHQEGAVLGFPRHLSGGVMGDRAVSEKKAQLVRMLVLGGALPGYAQPANVEDRASLIKCAYQAFGDDLSIGFYDMDQTAHANTASANAGAGVRLGQFRLGLPGVVAGATTQNSTIQYRDHSGFLRTEWKADATSHNASFSASMVGAGGIGPVVAGNPGGSIMASVAPFLAGSAQFFQKGVTDRRVQILQDGKELPTSFASRSFAAPVSFLHEFSLNVDQYAEDKARKFFPQDYAAGGETRANLIAREKARMIGFVDYYLAQRDLTATPQLYGEFGDNVEIANKLRATAHLAQQVGDPAAAKRAEKEISAIHSDPRYREGRFLINVQTEQEGRQVGLNGVMGLTVARNDSRRQQVISFT